MTSSKRCVLDAASTARIERVLGQHVVSAHRPTGGYTPVGRWVLRLGDGTSVFAKSGRDINASSLASWLRVEHRAYTALRASFIPKFIGWDDDGVQPILLLEDLSMARWPPPWSAVELDTLWATLDAMREIEPPSWARDIEESEREHLSGWERVSSEDRQFLSLGLTTRAWLDTALPTLVSASGGARLSGTSLVHFDLRSDNICFADGQMKIVDWNHIGRGNPDIDRVSILLSLHHEGGPEIVPDSHGLAALMSGYFGAQAGLPPIPRAPAVRQLQLKQLRVALAWVIRELGLPHADGPNAHELVPIT